MVSLARAEAKGFDPRLICPRDGLDYFARNSGCADCVFGAAPWRRARFQRAVRSTASHPKKINTARVTLAIVMVVSSKNLGGYTRAAALWKPHSKQLRSAEESLDRRRVVTRAAFNDKRGYLTWRMSHARTSYTFCSR
jgi:hypothetical protein